MISRIPKTIVHRIGNTIGYDFESFRIAADNGKDVSAWIKLGVNINQKDGKNKTALMYAAMKGHLDTVKQLCINGADVLLTDNDHYNALMYAAEYGCASVVRYLIHQVWILGVNPHDLTTSSGINLLMIAALSGNEDTLNEAIPYSKPSHYTVKRSSDEATILMIAAKKFKGNTIENILSAGAVNTINDRTKYGKYSALYYAVTNENTEAVAALIKASANLHEIWCIERSNTRFLMFDRQMKTMRMLVKASPILFAGLSQDCILRFEQSELISQDHLIEQANKFDEDTMNPRTILQLYEQKQISKVDADQYKKQADSRHFGSMILSIAIPRFYESKQLESDRLQLYKNVRYAFSAGGQQFYRDQAAKNIVAALPDYPDSSIIFKKIESPLNSALQTAENCLLLSKNKEHLFYLEGIFVALEMVSHNNQWKRTISDYTTILQQVRHSYSIWIALLQLNEENIASQANYTALMSCPEKADSIAAVLVALNQANILTNENRISLIEFAMESPAIEAKLSKINPLTQDAFDKVIKYYYDRSLMTALMGTQEKSGMHSAIFSIFGECKIKNKDGVSMTIAKEDTSDINVFSIVQDFLCKKM